MQRFFLGFVFLEMLSNPIFTNQADSYNLSIPAAVISSQNALEKTQLNFLFGVMTDRWIWNHHKWLFGPGIGLGVLMPAFSGNESVFVKPYFLFSELRFSGAYALFGNLFGVMPFFQIKSQLGANIVFKNVSEHKNISAAFEYALGPALGICYFIKKLGIALSYGITAGSEAVRQHLEISLVFNLKET